MYSVFHEGIGGRRMAAKWDSWPAVAGLELAALMPKTHNLICLVTAMSTKGLYVLGVEDD